MLSVPRQAARLPAAHGHYVHVGIAVVVAGEGDELPIGREVRAGFHARPHGEALRVRTVAVGQPDVAGIAEGQLVAAQGRLAQQQGFGGGRRGRLGKQAQAEQ